MSTSQAPSQSKIQNLQSLITNNQLLITYFLLALLILTYSLYFSWYTINRHNTLNSYAADLSLIDQPMWNTVLGPGGFMELTWGDHQQPRLAEHFEPILVPIAFLFFIWDDVRIILIAQTVALAFGALPVFLIAKNQFKIKNSKLKIQNWAALAFATAYLLYPHLQAANIADFHADPFVVTPLLFAFWYATQKHWLWMWFWAIIAMLTKENLPTLTAMLGLWLLLNAFLYPKSCSQTAVWEQDLGTSHWSFVIRCPSFIQGAILLAVSTAWFLITTFLIVSPLAQQYFGTDGPIYLSNRFSGGVAGLLPLLQEPARWQYLAGLFAAVGFLPLLAPELLILGLPVLIANFFSNFPGQYSGEQHYSAPLVAAFVLAAIYGTCRLVNKTSLREINGQPLKISVLIGACLWLLAWSLSYHTLHGWTPLSFRTEHYQMSPAAAQLPSFIAQIPPDAIVSASPGVHPHLAHRQVVYIFPTVANADYLLVDVTDISGVHPNDVRTQIMDLLNNGWHLLQADYGLLLAKKSSAPQNSQIFPASFFNFTRSDTLPAHPANLTFGNNQLQLLGYDILDDPDDGVSFRFYWQALEPLPNQLNLWPLIYNNQGELLNNPTQTPMIATVWYPPEKWQPGEIIVTQTLPQLLPDSFHLGIAAGITAGSFYNPAQRWPVNTGADALSIKNNPGNWSELAGFKRHGPMLMHYPPVSTFHSLTPVQAQFGPLIRLTGYRPATPTPQPGAELPILLEWTTAQPLTTDYTVFIHLLAADGSLVAQSDAYPAWLTPRPTSQWPQNQRMIDRHTLQLPSDLPSGTYTVQLGLYNAQTLERLTLPNGDNAFELTHIEIK